jgi:hypothetical protein
MEVGLRAGARWLAEKLPAPPIRPRFRGEFGYLNL